MVHASEFGFSYPTSDEPVLSGLSFELDAGSVLGVVGPVEAGKTTLAMALSGFAPQNTGGTTSGELSVAGRDPREADDTAVAMVFEDYSAQLTQVRVIDEVVAPLVNRGIPRADALDRARELLEQVRMADVADQFTWELSGGQQQRLAIAAALATDPDVLVFDTATDMLDPEGRDDVSNLISSLQGEMTLVVTANDPDALVGVADDLLVLDGGERVAYGPADELLRDAELLESVGVAPPVCVRIAREVGLPSSPLTPGEFLDALDRHTVGWDPTTGESTVAQADGGPERADGAGADNAAADGRTLLRADGVTYRYSEEIVAVEDVDLTVAEGEVHAIIGGNGAGKTTLSKLLVGLFTPDEGAVTVDGEPTEGRTARDVAESVGIALQNPDEQLSEQTVDGELRFPLARRRYERTGLLGLSKRERYDDAFIDERVQTIREWVGLPESVLTADPMFLPRGQRRLVTIASALAPDPDVLVLDEPVAGVDATARAHITRTIDRLRERGKGVVLIDHDMEFVCEVADTVTVLEDGRVAKQGPVETVFDVDNWEWLATRHLRPPRAARLARQVGVDALTADAFVEAFAPTLEVRG
ncbi:ABC transporter ATP-binding protein [Natronomonas sp. EA1]|uniref:ABC transporter ATP-binding protein n=1 Tax=Natronomonas sp. EA1 TaxID=3421655 RepID=UPI003EBD9936